MPAPVAGGIRLSSITVDDGDGDDPLTALVTKKLEAADTNKDGVISNVELKAAIRQSVVEIEEAKTRGIPIDRLDPTSHTSGFKGAVGATEQQIFERIKAADADGSGFINLNELFDVVRHDVRTTRKARTLKKELLAAMCVLFFAVFATVGLSWAVTFLAKDTKVHGGGTMISTEDDAVIKTATKLAALPLRAAPVMRQAQLALVSSAVVTVPSDLEPSAAVSAAPLPLMMKRRLAITGHRWYSRTAVVFEVGNRRVPTACIHRV